jgi:glycyl-tRNA synthetase
MSSPINFQSIIMKLQDFWSSKGCLIWQPYYSQVGAGTYNPATFLRVLGPEPWNVAYVEPSIRPDDGRYGENPNRLQQHYQFQVILKPDPGNPQEVYLNSLEALGIDPRRHDLRFVEDNWESPALGAWGLGWEVWLDGQEITQFTYFQQAGGVQIDPVAVEITYGLERIAIPLMRVNSFKEISWNQDLTYGDVNLQAEQEHSQYYIEVADVKNLRQMYELFESEAHTCLENGLVLPAYDYLLKCSHTFNVLDTRGAIGVTERQVMFGRMREMSKKVAQVYLEQRQRLEIPLIGKIQPFQSESAVYSPKPDTIGNFAAPTNSSAPLLLEIGTEELPVGDLDSALEQLEARLKTLLSEQRLAYQQIRVMGTPRRLVALVEGLETHQSDLEQLVKGPPADRAYNPDGTPTNAAEGFARSKGAVPADLEVRELDGGRYVTLLVRQEGKPSLQVLSEVLPGLIAALRFDRPMRWNSSNIFFSRPVRWLLAIYGEGANAQVVPFEYAGMQSGSMTRGLRFHQPKEYITESFKDYLNFLSAQGILLDTAERINSINEQINRLAKEAGGKIIEDAILLREVANLVEAPTAVLGSFDPVFLKLPREVLISVMKKHQRYFPVFAENKTPDGGEELLSHFITVRNGNDEWLDVVRDGNEHVLRARFADADFFVREDLKKPLEEYLPRLGTLLFQIKLGSMLDKSRRLQLLAEDLFSQISLSDEQQDTIRRAAYLCKADLATKMVIEMTSLQGQMGRYYALKSGETFEVAEAISDHYQPRFTGDRAARSLPGLVIGLADRLDTLMGLFAAGMAPSGNKDPFAQRRAALGIVQNLLTWNLDFNLRSGLDAASHHLPISPSCEHQDAVLAFLIERLRYVFLEQSRRYDIVDAVLAVQGENPARAACAIEELTNWVDRQDWNKILPAFARCERIIKDIPEIQELRPASLSEPAELELFEALKQAEATQRSESSVDDFLTVFLPMIPAVERFFNEVLVMADDMLLKNNRLALLKRIVQLGEKAADFSCLEGY